MPTESDAELANQLREAVVSGDCGRVRTLLNFGARIDVTYSGGKTILHHLFTHGVHYAKIVTILENILQTTLSRHGRRAVEAIINTADEDEKTAIYYATQNYGSGVSWFNSKENFKERDLGIFQLLVGAGARVTISDNNGVTPIHLSALRSSFCVFELLFNKAVREKSFSTEAVVEISDEEGDTPLYYLLSHENFIFCLNADEACKKIEFLIRNGSKVDNDIILKVIHRDEVVKLLLNPKLPSTLKFDFIGQLSLAAGNNNSSLFKVLVCAMVEARVDVNASDCNGQTALHLILGRWLNLDYTSYRDTEYNPYGLCSLNGSNFGLFDLLIDAGADVSAADVNGVTPLEMAITPPEMAVKFQKNSIFGTVDIVKIFLKTGRVNVNALCSGGQTLLSTAMSCNHDYYIDYSTKIAELLVKNGALVSAQNSDGNTPLHLAILNSNFEMAELAVKLGGTMIVNSVNKCNKRPIELAIEKGHSGIIDILCKNGASAPLSSIVDSISRGNFEAAVTLAKNDAVLGKAAKLALAVAFTFLAASSQEVLAAAKTSLNKASQNLPSFDLVLGVGLFAVAAFGVSALCICICDTVRGR